MPIVEPAIEGWRFPLLGKPLAFSSMNRQRGGGGRVLNLRRIKVACAPQMQEARDPHNLTNPKLEGCQAAVGDNFEALKQSCAALPAPRGGWSQA
jgi:hypothetical protein